MVIKDRENIFQKKFARLKKVRTFAARFGKEAQDL